MVVPLNFFVRLVFFYDGTECKPACLVGKKMMLQSIFNYDGLHVALLCSISSLDPSIEWFFGLKSGTKFWAGGWGRSFKKNLSIPHVFVGCTNRRFSQIF